MLKYALRENPLTPDENDYMAQVADSRSFSIEEIIDLMIQRGSTLTKADTRAALQIYGEVVSNIIADGNNINTPLVNTGLSVSGVFKGASDGFDPSRHSIKLHINAGTLLNDALRKVHCEKVQATDTNPYIAEVVDIVSGKANSVLTTGGIVQITGSRLKFDDLDDVQGIFFVPESGESVRCEIIAENKPARLMALIPKDLPQIEYYVEVRTKLSPGGKELRNLKVGRFTKSLTRIS